MNFIKKSRSDFYVINMNEFFASKFQIWFCVKKIPDLIFYIENTNKFYKKLLIWFCLRKKYGFFCK